jgi:hypothetical protein
MSDSFDPSPSLTGRWPVKTGLRDFGAGKIIELAVGFPSVVSFILGLKLTV